jgi:hypothetical protein
MDVSVRPSRRSTLGRASFAPSPLLAGKGGNTLRNGQPKKTHPHREMCAMAHWPALPPAGITFNSDLKLLPVHPETNPLRVICPGSCVQSSPGGQLFIVPSQHSRALSASLSLPLPCPSHCLAGSEDENETRRT